VLARLAAATTSTTAMIAMLIFMSTGCRCGTPGDFRIFETVSPASASQCPMTTHAAVSGRARRWNHWNHWQTRATLTPENAKKPMVATIASLCYFCVYLADQ
jgi:hypothetical protein